MALNLVGKIELDGAGFERGLKRAGQSVTDLVKNATVAAFGFYGVEQAIAKTVESASELVNEAKRLDVTVEQLQVLKQAAKDAGTNLESVAGALEKIDLARSKALQGDPASLAAFAKLGVGRQQLQNSTAADIFTGAISGAAKNNSTREIGPALREVFGKGFGELVPVLKTNFDDVADKLKKFGLQTDALTAVKLKNMGEEFDLVSLIITTVLGPTLVKFADWLLGAISHSKLIESVDFLAKRSQQMANAADFVDSHGTHHSAEIRAEAANDFRDRIGKALTDKEPFDQFRAHWKFAFSGVMEDFKGNTFAELSKYLNQLSQPLLDANNAAAKSSGADMTAFQKMVSDFQDRMQKAAKEIENPKPPGPPGPPDGTASRAHIPTDALLKVGNFLGSNGNTIARVNQQKISLMTQQLHRLDRIHDTLKQGAGGGNFGMQIPTV